jgi:hypothetical protein
VAPQQIIKALFDGNLSPSDSFSLLFHTVVTFFAHAVFIIPVISAVLIIFSILVVSKVLGGVFPDRVLDALLGAGARYHDDTFSSPAPSATLRILFPMTENDFRIKSSKAERVASPFFSYVIVSLSFLYFFEGHYACPGPLLGALTGRMGRHVLKVHKAAAPKTLILDRSSWSSSESV